MQKHSVTFPENASLDAEDAKQALRAQARARRARRNQHERELLGHQWVDTVLDFVGDAKTIACYVSVNNEPPTGPICAALAQRERRLLLPKLGPRLAREWAWYRGPDDLKVMAPGRPPEPTGPALGSSVLAEVEALIIPALLVDHHGRRIGQGGGWYDRVLKQVSATTRIGAMVFPEEYVAEELPQDPMDRPVPYVLLPDEWFACDVPSENLLSNESFGH